MTNRVKGTLIGVGFSLGAVVIWVVLGLIGIIAGIAGALMGILFVIGYRKFNPEDKTLLYISVFASLLIIVEVIIAELLTIAVVANSLGVSFSGAMGYAEVKKAVILDIALGLGLSFLVFTFYLVSLRRKDSSKTFDDRRIYTGTEQQNNVNNNTDNNQNGGDNNQNGN